MGQPQTPDWMAFWQFQWSGIVGNINCTVREKVMAIYSRVSNTIVVTFERRGPSYLSKSLVSLRKKNNRRNTDIRFDDNDT